MYFRNDYDTIDKRVRSRSSVNLDNVVSARRRENFYVYLLIILVVSDLIHWILAEFSHAKLGLLVMIFMISFGTVFISSRKAGFGMSYKSFMYVRYGKILNRELKVEEILFDNIQYLDVKNHLFSTSIDLRYIDSKGKASEINFSINKYIIDKNQKRFNNDRKIICKKLADLQKVLDKGDF